MFDFIKKKIRNKIMFSLFVLMTINGLAVAYFTTQNVNEDVVATTKENLHMLNTAMFQSLRNAMNTGDSVQIKQAEEDARGIKGVKSLIVAKSQPLIDMYSPNESISEDKNIIKSFETKEEILLETNNKDGHNMRMIKPMIATPDCLSCHANQQEGDVIGVMDLTFSLDNSDAHIFEITKFIIIISVVFGFITMVLIYFQVKKITKPIDGLKNGFENLIITNDSNIKLDIKSSDEIGDVAKLFNQYMNKIQEGLKQDELVIEEANDILEKTGNGFFVYEVKATAANPYVEDLKTKLNHMIQNTKETLDSINLNLRNFAESKYDYRMDASNIYGDLGSVAAGIRLVGKNTSEILAMIMNTGDSLNQNTNTLSTAANALSTSSNKQAASLEETAAALEEITANIQGNTQASSQMAQLAQNVTSSANSGQELANSTANAMDEINVQVTSINDAIEVIDQIAFQTNILSLNAAVEAATAGETGKGFAVVAQEVRNLAARSAQAANEIKSLVEEASTKSKEGKVIASNMILGYEGLNDKVLQTKQMIDDVSQATKEQEEGMVQINDAINSLDKVTQENASTSSEIDTLSAGVAELSTRLNNITSKANLAEDVHQKVNDIELTQLISKFKNDHINFKDEHFSKLDSKEKWEVEKCHTCDLGDWITQSENNNTAFVNSNQWNTLKNHHSSLHNNLHDYIHHNSQGSDNNILQTYANIVEENTLDMFKSLDDILLVNANLIKRA